MLKPIGRFSKDFRTRFCSNPKSSENYNDPLLKWPLRGTAFTNEVGEGLRPLIGNYATLSWIPALLYIGADIYDKYKNNETEYSPSSQRGLQQAIFQGLASIFLPLVAIKTGQNIFSLYGLKTKSKLTINAQEHITKLAQQYVANGKLRAHKNNDQECIKEFTDIVLNNIDYKKQTTQSSNFFRKATLWCEDKIHTLSNFNNKENIKLFAEKTIKDAIKLRKDLLNPQNSNSQDSWQTSFKTALESGQTKNVAVKSVLNKFLEKSTLKGKGIKTIGGFTALGLTIKPIDTFVEDVLIGKIVEPSFSKQKSPH